LILFLLNEQSIVYSQETVFESPTSVNEDDKYVLDASDPSFVEHVAYLPECVRFYGKERIACTRQAIARHILEKFNMDIAREANLEQSSFKIIIGFEIDRKGDVKDNISIVETPTQEIGKEAERVIRTLPTFTPAQQRGKTVSVKYLLPIRIEL